MRQRVLLLLTLVSVAIGLEGARYLIICADSFVDVVQPLAKWKTEKGMLARIVPTCSTGTDTAQIRNYIKNAYDNWPIRPEYVLLVGSPDFIPSRNNVNDCYYGDMSGDYKMELPVGRFWVGNLRECSTQVAKVLAYELPADTGDTSWFLKGTTVVREDVPPDSYYQDDSRFVRKYWENNGYILAESLADFWGHNSSHVTAAANDGRVFITYRGQGTATWYSPFHQINPYSWVNGAKLPIVIAGTCATVTLYPGETMYGDKFVRAGSPDALGGAIAYFGSTLGANHVSKYRSACFRGFFHALYQEGCCHLGTATLRGRFWVDSLYSNVNRYIEWNLLGDPELNVWTGRPRRPTVTYDTVIPMMAQQWTVKVELDSHPFSGALVCLSMDTVLYDYQVTNHDGEASFSINPPHTGTMKLVVTGKNLRPHIGTCRVAFYDVGCTRIMAPPASVDSGTVVTPSCQVYNYGDHIETYQVRMKIGTSYHQTKTVIGHFPGETLQVTFPNWTAPSRGTFAVSCSTGLRPDLNPENDRTQTSTTVLVHDVAVKAIATPLGLVHPGLVTPQAVVVNYGTDRESTKLHFIINDGGLKYHDSILLPTGLPFCDTLVSFPGWNGSVGSFTACCYTRLATEQIPDNDTACADFWVVPVWPEGWHEAQSLPAGPSGKMVKDGAWLAFSEDNQRIYAAKGNKTSDFYCYFVDGDSWQALAQIKPGTENRLPRKGCVGCADGQGHIFMTKGNNTLGFWRYDIGGDSWVQLIDVPLGASGKRVKGGTDMVYVVQNDTGYVYLLKGYKADFLCYNTVTGQWQSLPDAPAGAYPKWEKGSWLVYDGNRFIYAHKAKVHEFRRFDIAARAWDPLVLKGMPFLGSSGKSKKSKDGGCAAYYDGSIYALKGGNTCEFWRYFIAGDSWKELDPMPEVGSTGKKKRV
ncbi:MAG: C25 family cysteine peptidase, partial [candidate division WOR-3 bacterium]